MAEVCQYNANCQCFSKTCEGCKEKKAVLAYAKSLGEFNDYPEIVAELLGRVSLLEAENEVLQEQIFEMEAEVRTDKEEAELDEAIVALKRWGWMIEREIIEVRANDIGRVEFGTTMDMTNAILAKHWRES